MRKALFDAFALHLQSLDLPDMRLFTSSDGPGLGQIRRAAGVARIRLTGRPDGLRPGGFETSLQCCAARNMNTATGKPAMRPLDWMELEREYAQYDERSRAVLNAALNECRAQQDATALALCRLCCADTDLLFAIIDFVRRNHPAGRLSDAGPNSRTSLAVRKALAEALARLVEGDVARAEQYLRTGIDNMLYAAGAERAESNVDVQRLENLADQIAATRSAQTTAAPAVQYAVTVD